MTWVEPNWFHDAELLGRIGRSPLASTLDMLAPFLAQQKMSLPDPSLPDPRYFAELAVIFRSQPIKIAVYLPPFLTAGPPSQAPTPAAAARPPAPPEPDAAERSIAAKVFELLTALDSDNRLRKAPLLKVFNLYYRQRLQPAEVARKCACDRSLIFIRLATIREKVPWGLQQLQEVSPHVEAMEEALEDSRAEDIYRKGAVYGEEEDDDA